MNLENELKTAKAGMRAVVSTMRDGMPYYIRKDMPYKSRLAGKKLQEVRAEIRETKYN